MILNLNISYNGDILRSLEVDTSKINTKVLKEKASNRYLVNRYEVNISDDIKEKEANEQGVKEKDIFKEIAAEEVKAIPELELTANLEDVKNYFVEDDK